MELAGESEVSIGVICGRVLGGGVVVFSHRLWVGNLVLLEGRFAKKWVKKIESPMEFQSQKEILMGRIRTEESDALCDNIKSG